MNLPSFPKLTAITFKDDNMKKTYVYRIKKGDFLFLEEMSSNVNLVWNYINELYRLIKKRYRCSYSNCFPPNYEGLTSYFPCGDGFGFTKGASEEINLPQTTINKIADIYTTSLKTAKNNPKFKGFIQFRSKYSELFIPYKFDNNFKIEQKKCEKTNKFYTKISYRFNNQIKHFICFKDREINGTIKTIIFKRNNFGNWFANITVEQEVEKANNINYIGVDLGANKSVYCSDGYNSNSIDIQSFVKKIKTLQKSVARKYNQIRKTHQLNEKTKIPHNIRSKRLILAEKKLAQLHAKLARIRLDKNHKDTRHITKQAGKGVVVMEKLSVSNMTKSAKGTVENPGKNVAAKSGLNKSFLNAAPYQIRTQIKYKMKNQGGEVIEVPAAYTSLTCSKCHHVAQKGDGTRNGSKFHCPKCNNETHADLNAAINIKNAGLKVLDLTSNF